MKPRTGDMKVSILGKEYSVVCGEDQRQALTEAAGHLDSRMRQVQKAGKLMGAERCAIMAALNITHELLGLQKESKESQAVHNRLQNLRSKIDIVVQEQKELL